MVWWLGSPCAVEDKQPTVGERWWKLTPKKKRLSIFSIATFCHFLPLSAALKKAKGLRFPTCQSSFEALHHIESIQVQYDELAATFPPSNSLERGWNWPIQPVGESGPPSTVVHVCGSESVVYVDPSSALIIGKHWNLQNRSSHWLRWAEMNGLQSPSLAPSWKDVDLK